MNKKTIYIPGFGNETDAIYQYYLGNEGDIVQKSLKTVSKETIKKFLEKYGNEGTFQKLKEIYPDIDKEQFEKSLTNIDGFKGFTRNLKTVIALTVKEIHMILKEERHPIRIVGHSQGGLVVMLSILKNPSLLHKIDHIELLAPVSSLKVGRNFHKGDKGYLNPKNIIVTEEYIHSLEGNGNILFQFLDLLEEENYEGEVSLILGDNDPVIDIHNFNLKEIRNAYPFLEMKVIHGDHYLGYKK